MLGLQLLKLLSERVNYFDAFLDMYKSYTEIFNDYIGVKKLRPRKRDAVKYKCKKNKGQVLLVLWGRGDQNIWFDRKT